MGMTTPQAENLRRLLDGPDVLMLPSCFDALSAKLIGQAGFAAGFVSGFAVSAARLGMPDTGLISFGEMRDQVRDICGIVPNVAMVVDGDTGYGNAINAQRTVREHARAGAACVMIEDQVSPKRCGHTRGKSVVDRSEARLRVRAAVQAAHDAGILLMARTDARAVHGFDDALDRCRMFADEGADLIFMEAPETEDEMARACRGVDRPMMANMITGGRTPVLSRAALRDIGYRLAVYPMVPLGSAIAAMQSALAALREGAPPVTDFEEIKRVVGFGDYYASEERYKEG